MVDNPQHQERWERAPGAALGTDTHPTPAASHGTLGAPLAGPPAQLPRPPDAPLLWDPAVLEGLRASVGDSAAALLLEVVGVWLEHSVDQMVELKAAAADPNPTADRLARAAHTLRGNSATVGATALTQALARVENAARAGNVPDAVAAVAQCVSLYDPSREAVERGVRAQLPA